MTHVWAIAKIRPLLQAERTEAMLLGLRCACGGEVTHDTIRRYLTADGVREAGMKRCAACVTVLEDDLMFYSTKDVVRRKTGAKG